MGVFQALSSSHTRFINHQIEGRQPKNPAVMLYKLSVLALFICQGSFGMVYTMDDLKLKKFAELRKILEDWGASERFGDAPKFRKLILAHPNNQGTTKVKIQAGNSRKTSSSTTSRRSSPPDTKNSRGMRNAAHG